MATAAGTITMSMREADRLKTIQAVVDRMLGVGQAAQRMGISTRQVGRLLARYRAEGPMGLVSRKRGLLSNHQLEPGVAERAVRLIRDRYADFGPTLAREKLAECDGLDLAKETVRRLMIGASLWTPRRQRAAKIHQLRNRRACYAMPWPPPMHIVTKACRPPVRCSSWIALVVMIAPVAPTGWPRDTPEPFGLTLAGSRSSSLVTAQACAAKASLLSTTSRSRTDRPAFFSASLVAGTGPIPIRRGSTPA